MLDDVLPWHKTAGRAVIVPPARADHGTAGNVIERRRSCAHIRAGVNEKL